jgi:hypothetical protein
MKNTFLGYEIVTTEIEDERFGNRYEAIATYPNTDQIVDGWGATEAEAIARAKGSIAFNCAALLVLDLLYSKRHPAAIHNLRYSLSFWCGAIAKRIVGVIVGLGF